MSVKGLLIAVVALAVLGGAVWFSNRKEKEKAAKPSDNTTKILTIPEDQFKEVKLKKTGGPETVLKKGDDGKWQITEPKPYHADQDAVSSMVTSLASLNADKLIEDKAADLAAYGLSNPSLDVTVVKKDGKSQDLLIGDDTPTSSGAYAKLAGDPRVFTIASFTKSGLDKTPNDLRDKRLLTFDSDKLTRVDLEAKGEAVEFGKNAGGDWQILKPKPLRADNSQVDELIRKLKDAKMDLGTSEEDAKKAASGFASGAKVATASVTDASGTQHLEVRKDKDKNYYAKSSVVEGVYKIQSDLGDGVDKGLNDFRNKKLFDFGWNDPGKVQIGTAVYQKSGDKWTSGSKTMDSATVQALIDKLRDLQAAKLLDAGGGGAAVLEATVTSNDGKRVEKVTITKQGDKYYGRRENEPTVYELDNKAVDDLLKAAGGVKEAAPAAAAAKKK